jgi:hypothetical protein
MSSAEWLNYCYVATNKVHSKNRMGFMKKKISKVKERSKSYKYNPTEWDDSKSTPVTPEKKNSGISTSVRLPKEMVAKLRKVAKKKGDIGYQTLLKIWIAERLEKESV